MSYTLNVSLVASSLQHLMNCYRDNKAAHLENSELALIKVQHQLCGNDPIINMFNREERVNSYVEHLLA